MTLSLGGRGIMSTSSGPASSSSASAMLSTASSSTPQAKQLQKQRQEYVDHRAATEKLQADLRQHAATMCTKQSWDAALQAGVEEWISDRGNVWRVLRKMEYNHQKALDVLLQSLDHRIRRSLHLPIPGTNPVSNTPFQYILPLPLFTDKLGRPILVFSPRAIARDETGSLAQMDEWVWWTMEMMRRVLRDWWVQGGGWDNSASMAGLAGKNAAPLQVERTGYKGDGCVMVVDVEGAGLRNIDLELQSHMKTVSLEGFPGMTDAIFVANAGWTARSLWGGIKRLLPVSSLEKVQFLESRKVVVEFFDPQRFPRALGGDAPYVYARESNTVWKRYAQSPAA